MSTLFQSNADRIYPRLELLEDRLAPAIYTVTTASDNAVAGKMTFREAIQASNASVGVLDTINFDIGDGIQKIEVTKQLDTIVDPVVIDALAVPAGHKTQQIHLDGNKLNEGLGLRITAGNSSIKGLVIVEFPDAGIELDENGNNKLLGNYIGIDRLGDPGIGNGKGVEIRSSGNIVGGKHSVANEYNVIAGNLGDGVHLFAGKNNVIKGNYIGTTPTDSGTLNRGNEQNGIYLGESSTSTLIGGTSVDDRNIISQNRQNGIHIEFSGKNTISGNYIGTNSLGRTAFPNLKNGILVDAAGMLNTIGGPSMIPGAGAGNVISGNGQDGVSINHDVAIGNAIENSIQGNIIGLNVDGLIRVPNGVNGVAVHFIAGRTTQIGGDMPNERNIISGNKFNGIRIYSEGKSVPAIIQGNFIGTTINGKAGNNVGNGAKGISVNNSSDIFIGGLTNTPGTGAGNVISGNGQAGIHLDAPFAGDTSRVKIQGNLIGTEASGMAAYGNGSSGISINGGTTAKLSDNVIGGADAKAKNIIAGNSSNGIRIVNSPTLTPGSVAKTTVQGNYIGVAMNGTQALANGGDGVHIEHSSSNIVGGGNIISGNTSFGVHIIGELRNGTYTSQGNQVQKGLIGVDVNMKKLPNGTGNIRDDGGKNTQYISNTIGYGIGSGIVLDSTIDAFLSGNNVFGNLGNGIELFDSVGTVVETNYIGTDDLFTPGLGNGGDGIHISGNSQGTTIDSQNVISNNSGSGISIAAGTQHTISDNSIYANTGLGIDLGDDGVTLNDGLLDADTGANDLQNFPVITSAVPNGQAGLDVAGYLESYADSTFRLEFFGNSVGDPSGYGQGEVFLGSVDVTTDSTGLANFSTTLAFSFGTVLSATATRYDDHDSDPLTPDVLTDTSEFSLSVTIGGSPTATIGNFVWDDTNADGIQDVGEPGMAGVTVDLFDDAFLWVDGTITDQDGFYQFDDVAAGNYQLMFTAPMDYVFTSQDQGVDDTLDSDADPTGMTGIFSVSASENVDHIDAGLVFEGPPPLGATIGNFVWEDTNGDGIQDVGENGLQGVTVELRDTLGVLIATTVSDEFGYYQFTDVAPGDYYLAFQKPAGYNFTLQDQGFDDMLDSDVDANGVTAFFSIFGGEFIDDLDAGLVLAS